MRVPRRRLLAAASLAAVGLTGSGCAVTSGGSHSAAHAALTRIGFGSCADQNRPAPIWDTIAAERPDLFLFGGDNVYASEPPWRVERLRAAYAKLGAHAGFAKVRQTPHMAIWDDHDYGRNDAGGEFEFKAASKAEFLDFWAVPADDPRRLREGLYHARTFGPAGQRVQVIMLDVRWARSLWTPSDQRGAPGKERYVPDSRPGLTMLGEPQWQWLAAQLREPADLRLLVSGIQVTAEGHGWEHWGLMPSEQARLFDLIRSTRAAGVVLLSGDRHIGAVYRRSQGVPYPLTELTSSGLTHAWTDAAEAGPNRLGDLVRSNHYALIEIDWASGRIALIHKDTQGAVLQRHDVRLSELRPV